MIGPAIESWNASLEGWFGSLGGPVEAVLRLSLAALFGGLVGMEREVRGRQAGFRTHILVCVGSALVMLVSIHFADYNWKPIQTGRGIAINLDPARVAYGVMTGVGFLGAGAIVQSKAGPIRGLTTAAALWCVAAIGLSIGFGMYLIAMLATIVVVTSLWLLQYFEKILPRIEHRTVTVRRRYEPGCIETTVKFVQSTGVRVIESNYKRADDLSTIDVDLRISFKGLAACREMERRIDDAVAYELIASREV